MLSKSYTSDPTQNTTYTYDDMSDGNLGKGRLTSFIDPSGSTRYHYDTLGRIIKKQTIIEGRPYRWEYSYDLAGNLASLVYPSGREVLYERNVLGQISAVRSKSWSFITRFTTLAQNYHALPFGPLVSFDYGNGVNHVITHDLDYRVNTINSQGSHTVLNRQYDYYLTNTIQSILRRTTR